MAILRGEEVVFGLGIEDPDARGTAVAPQVWIPARAASTIRQSVKKVLIKETRGTKMESSGSEVVERHAEGEVEFNVRPTTIGFFLKSLLGSVESAPRSGQAGVFDHEFSLLASSPEHASLTGVLHQPGIMDYSYPLMVVTSLNLNVSPDDLVTATAGLLAKDEVEAGTDAFTPDVGALDAVDPYFRSFDASLRFGDDVAEATDPDNEIVCVREMSLEIANGARIDQCISEVSPGNVVVKTLTVKGSFKADFDSTEKYDWMKDNVKKACVLELQRADKDIASTTIHPTLTITLPNVTIENVDFDRPIDDVVTASFEFVAHYDVETSSGITVALANGREDYLMEAGS